MLIGATFLLLSRSRWLSASSVRAYIYIHVHGYGGVCMCTFPFFSLSLQSSFSFHFFFLLLVTLFFIGLLLHIEIGVSWRYSIFETLLHNVFTEYTFRSLMLVFFCFFFHFPSIRILICILNFSPRSRYYELKYAR